VQTSHAVPYLSQFESAHLVAEFIAGTLPTTEDPRWAESGAADPEEYAPIDREALGRFSARRGMLIQPPVTEPPALMA
jgi:hypothetical protein